MHVLLMSVSAPVTCTRAVLPPWWIPAHTMMDSCTHHDGFLHTPWWIPAHTMMDSCTHHDGFLHTPWWIPAHTMMLPPLKRFTSSITFTLTPTHTRASISTWQMKTTLIWAPISPSGVTESFFFVWGGGQSGGGVKGGQTFVYGRPRGLHRNDFFYITFIVHNQKSNGGPMGGPWGEWIRHAPPPPPRPPIVTPLIWPSAGSTADAPWSENVTAHWTSRNNPCRLGTV